MEGCTLQHRLCRQHTSIDTTYFYTDGCVQGTNTHAHVRVCLQVPFLHHLSTGGTSFQFD